MAEKLTPPEIWANTIVKHPLELEERLHVPAEVAVPAKFVSVPIDQEY